MRWHATTGLTDEQLTELTQRAQAHLGGWRWDISQPTVSRIYRMLRRVLGAVAEAKAVRLADVEPDEQVLLDACLLPVGERRGHRELFSGKRHASGVNVHVVGDRPAG